eukprot:TRINITY_DN9671_c0_g2_i2.p1 TRINITY_DN9671_c0_g2~~TRINITY_DN9671_c0_g2_i2.p1  ORF type:complete len:117 (+),score=2.49 TRINITY_DN9671_c0_g2_i2:27-353(+)
MYKIQVLLSFKNIRIRYNPMIYPPTQLLTIIAAQQQWDQFMEAEVYRIFAGDLIELFNFLGGVFAWLSLAGFTSLNLGLGQDFIRNHSNFMQRANEVRCARMHPTNHR